MRISRLLGILFLVTASFVLWSGAGFSVLHMATAAVLVFVGMLLLSRRPMHHLRLKPVDLGSRPFHGTGKRIRVR